MNNRSLDSEYIDQHHSQRTSDELVEQLRRGELRIDDLALLDVPLQESRSLHRINENTSLLNGIEIDDNRGGLVLEARHAEDEIVIVDELLQFFHGRFQFRTQ